MSPLHIRSDMASRVGPCCRISFPSPHLRAMAWPWRLPSQSTTTQKPVLKTRSRCRPKPSIQKLLLKADDSQEQLSERTHAIGVNETVVWLPEAPSVDRPRAEYNAAALAYLGDAIYELYVRRHFLVPPRTMDSLNSRVMAMVCCEAQDAVLHQLLEGSFLTEEERDIVRWGGNVVAANKRAKSRAGNAVYSNASSLETLIGYLYLQDSERLRELMKKIGLCEGL